MSNFKRLFKKTWSIIFFKFSNLFLKSIGFSINIFNFNSCHFSIALTHIAQKSGNSGDVDPPSGLGIKNAIH